MTNTSSIKKIAIISSFFLVAVLLLIFLFALPLFNEIGKYSQSIINKNMEFSFFERESTQSKEFEKNQESLNADIDKIDSSFAKSEAPIDLIKFWENTAELCGLSIDISPISVNEIKSSAWEEIGFSLQLKGTFPNALRFIEKMENGPYLLQVQNYSSVLNQNSVNTEIKVTAFTK